MLDKVKLYTQDFEIQERNKLILRPGEIDLNSGEVLNEYRLFGLNGENDKGVFGSRAYMNNKEYKNWIVPYNVDIDRRGLFLNFNPSLIYYQDHNLYSIMPMQLKVVTDRIKESLEENGIRLNFDSMYLSRLDLQRTVYMDFPFTSYNTVMGWLEGKRLKQVRYPGSFSFRNMSREIIFYDKLLELDNNYGVKREDLYLHNSLFKLTGQENLMRGELRFRKKKVVEHNLNITRAEDLYSNEVYHHLSKRYKELLNELVFSQQKSIKDIANIEGDINLLRYLREKHKRGQIDRFLIVLGANEIVKRYKSMQEFRSILVKAGYSRRHSYRYLRKLRSDLALEREVNKKMGSNTSGFSSLYEELCTKFIKKVA